MSGALHAGVHFDKKVYAGVHFDCWCVLSVPQSEMLTCFIMILITVLNGFMKAADRPRGSPKLAQ